MDLIYLSRGRSIGLHLALTLAVLAPCALFIKILLHRWKSALRKSATHAGLKSLPGPKGWYLSCLLCIGDLEADKLASTRVAFNWQRLRSATQEQMAEVRRVEPSIWIDISGEHYGAETRLHNQSYHRARSSQQQT